MGACHAALRGDQRERRMQTTRQRGRRAHAHQPNKRATARHRAPGAVGAFWVRPRDQGREKGHDIAALLRDRRSSIQI